MKLFKEIENMAGEDDDLALKDKLREIKFQMHLIKSNQRKINGIEPENLDESDILHSI